LQGKLLTTATFFGSWIELRQFFIGSLTQYAVLSAWSGLHAFAFRPWNSDLKLQ